MNEYKINKELHTWPKTLKIFIIGFLFLLSTGVSTGLFFLFTTTSLTLEGTVEHYDGTSISTEDRFSVQEKYSKPMSEMLLTTHNHYIGFSFIFFILGGLFYFNSTVKGGIKKFLLVEPFVSTWLTFASLWGLRYIDTNFVYITFIAAILTYASFYFMVIILIYELVFKRTP